MLFTENYFKESLYSRIQNDSFKIFILQFCKHTENNTIGTHIPNLTYVKSFAVFLQILLFLFKKNNATNIVKHMCSHLTPFTLSGDIYYTEVVFIFFHLFCDFKIYISGIIWNLSFRKIFLSKLCLGDLSMLIYTGLNFLDV